MLSSCFNLSGCWQGHNELSDISSCCGLNSLSRLRRKCTIVQPVNASTKEIHLGCLFTQLYATLFICEWSFEMAAVCLEGSHSRYASVFCLLLGRQFNTAAVSPHSFLISGYWSFPELESRIFEAYKIYRFAGYTFLDPQHFSLQATVRENGAKVIC